MTARDAIVSPQLFFFQQFLKNPKMIGSVIPTARSTINALLDPVDWSGVRCVVEYGPGTGVFTRAILARVPAEALVIAIDTNPVFTAYLRRAITDPRFRCVDGSAAEVERHIAGAGLQAADYIVSGLPFSTLPPGVGDAIMSATARAIRPAGQFLVYQYSDFVLPMLEAHFGGVTTRRSWFCIPPAKLFWAHKEAAREPITA